MKTNGKSGLAILLIVLGALIILNKAGFIFGNIFGYLIGFLFPAALIFLGYISIKNGSRIFGWVVAIVGIVMLLGKLSGLIGLLIAVGFILYGVNLLRNRAY